MSWLWHCDLCGISCANGSRESHIRGKKHQMNERRSKGETRSAFNHVSGNEAFTSNIQAKKPPTTNNSTKQQSKVKELLLQSTYKLTKSPPQDDAVKKKEAPAVFPIFQPRKPKSPRKTSKLSEAYRNAFKRKRDVNLYVKDGQVWWEFSYNQKAMDAIKEYIPGRKWNPAPIKQWSNPLESLPEAVELYEFMGRTASQDLKDRAAGMRKACGGTRPSEVISLTVVLEGGHSKSAPSDSSSLLQPNFGTVNVKFTYNADIVSAIKMLPPNQRSFDPVTKQWPIDLLALPDLVEHLLPLGYAPCDKLKALCQACRDITQALYTIPTDDDDDNVSSQNDNILCQPIKKEPTMKAPVLSSSAVAAAAVKQEQHEEASSSSEQTTQQQLEVGIQKTVSLLVQHKTWDSHGDDFDRSDCGQAQAKRQRLTHAQERWSRRRRGEYDSDDDDGFGFDVDYNGPDSVEEKEEDNVFYSSVDTSFSSKLAARLSSLSRINKAKRAVDCDCGRPDIMSGDVHICRYFGTYHCGCGNVWTSSYTWKGEKQACRSCNIESFPATKEKLQSGMGILRGGMGAHDQARCSRCRTLGRNCTISR